MKYTSLEQSRELIGLGLDPSTADMDHYKKKDGWVTLPRKQISYGGFQIIPCWSLDALLDLMPKPMEYQGSFCYPELDLFSHKIYYMVGGATYLIIGGMDNLDAAYNTVVWLIKNKCIGSNK